MTEREPVKLTTGQKVAVSVLGLGVGAVFLAGCYRAVLWILGVG